MSWWIFIFISGGHVPLRNQQEKIHRRIHRKIADFQGNSETIINSERILPWDLEARLVRGKHSGLPNTNPKLQRFSDAPPGESLDIAILHRNLQLETLRFGTQPPPPKS